MSPASIPLVVLAAGLGRRFGGPKQLAPVGPHGELLVDYTAHDASQAGFSPIVVVVRDEIEKPLAAHIERTWPPSLPVILARQAVPAGTADAVLAARPHLTASFAVANADDLYPTTAYTTLHDHLTSPGQAAGRHAVIGFALGTSMVGRGPVRRAVCEVDHLGHLTGIAEHTVTPDLTGPSGPHGQLLGTAGSGPAVPLEWASTVSMNMWGFRQSILPHLESAVARSLGPVGPEVGTGHRRGEVILPDVVAGLLAGPARESFVVLPERGRCLGVTHGEDLAQLAEELGRLVDQGDRPARLWVRSGGSRAYR